MEFVQILHFLFFGFKELETIEQSSQQGTRLEAGFFVYCTLNIYYYTVFS